MIKILAFCLLIVSSSVFAADMTETCAKFIGDFDSLIAKASENEAAKPQVDILKTQMSQAKVQFSSMSVQQLDIACKQGIDMMGQMKTSLGIN